MAHYVEMLVEQAVESLNDDGVLIVHRFLRDLKQGKYRLGRGTPADISALDILFQNYRQYDQIGHACMALRLWGAVVTHPETITSVFRVGGEPYPDRAVEANNKRLAQGPQGFRAVFEPDNWSNRDGFVWPPVHLGHRKDQFPLQVGSVCPANLAFNLQVSGGFARWPYGSEHVYVFDPPGPQGPFLLDRLEESHLEKCKEWCQ